MLCQCSLSIKFVLYSFQVHIKKHTEPAPFSCPKCDESFSDTSKVCQHLAERHLPKKSDANLKVEAEKPKKEVSIENQNFVKSENQENVKQNVLEALVRFRRKSGGLARQSSESSDKMKDENAVNREIAALLLNLHASRGAPKPEDLSLKTTPNGGSDSAMDLTKSKTSAATITKLVSMLTLNFSFFVTVFPAK